MKKKTICEKRGWHKVLTFDRVLHEERGTEIKCEDCGTIIEKRERRKV